MGRVVGARSSAWIVRYSTIDLALASSALYDNRINFAVPVEPEVERITAKSGCN
jgi:hypothetical protein